MNKTVTICRTYKYRLYRCDKKDRKLRYKIFAASTIWNHFIALQRRYYRLSGKYFSLTQMNNHVLKLRKTERFELWRTLHSQVCQNVCRRVDDAYQRFFKGLVKKRPKFKKARKYASFTFPQSGYKVNTNTVTIDGITFKFVKHRAMVGDIKTLTIKRDKVGRLWFVFTVSENISIGGTSTGKSGGFDFGLKEFLVDDEGLSRSNPSLFIRELRTTRKLNRQLARKVQGSTLYKRKMRKVAKHNATIHNKRRDHHFKLAHQLCDEYDMLYIADLSLRAMRTLWGRKASDLGFANFQSILEWIAFKRGKQIIKVNRFAPITRTCTNCGNRHTLTLKDRSILCNCGQISERDYEAALKTKPVGASTGYHNGSKPKVTLRNRVDGSSLHL